MFEVSVEEMFSAGHALRNYRGKCENVHGHNWRVMVTFVGQSVDKAGMLVDFVEVKKSMSKVIDYLDHQFINDVKPFDELSPSAENIAKFFFDRMTADLEATPADVPCKISRVKIWETDDASATYVP
jgi:6-pyruvoyltetrahydropterin/6-carboxytetrahydropterin synthase